MKYTFRLIEGCAILLVFLFVYASTSKLFGYALFRYQLQLYPWVKHIGGLVSWGLPVFELLIAGLLLSLRRRLLGFYLSFGLLIIFTVYLSIMLAMGQHLPCSCGGVISELTWRQHVVFNGVFISIAALGIVYEKRRLAFKFT